jgi:hypothetical protein
MSIKGLNQLKEVVMNNFFETIVYIAMSALGCVLRLEDFYKGSFVSEKTKSLLTVVIENCLRVVLYRKCNCNKSPECPRCGGKGIVSGTIGGKLVAPQLDEHTGKVLSAGTQVATKRQLIKMALSAGLTKFIHMNVKEIPCKCGGKGCQYCIKEKKGTSPDRWLVTFPGLQDKREVVAAIAAFLCTVREQIKGKNFPYLAIPLKGGQVIMATPDALRELDPILLDGKLIKRVGYYVGNFMWENKSPSQVYKIAVLKDEWRWNGLTLLNTNVVLNSEEYEAVAIRNFVGGVLKGTVRGINKSELVWSLKHLRIIEDVDGITTDEMVKSLANGRIISENDRYYIIEVDIKDFYVVAPPVKGGWPSIGLSLWKYGIEGLKLAKGLIHQVRPNNAVTILKRALEGNFQAECKVLGIKHPRPEDEGQIPGFCFSIPRLVGNMINWSNPKDNKSFRLMFERFRSYFEGNIAKITTEGLKQVLASGSVILDALQDACDVAHAEAGIDPVLLCILPNQKIHTIKKKVDMTVALASTTHGFVVKKDPAASILHFLPVTTVGKKMLEHFIDTGEYKLFADDEAVLCKKGAILMASKWMMTMCKQDMDGDKVDLLFLKKECIPSLPPVTNWDEMYADNIASLKVDLKSDQEALEYYSNLAVTILAARGAIGPMVKGSVAGAFERMLFADNEGMLDKLPADGWLSLQRAWNAIGEIFAIKKEKSMADGSKVLTWWTEVVDLGRDLWNEGYKLAKGSKVKDESGSYKALRKIYMNLLSLKPVYEEEEDGEESYEEDGYAVMDYTHTFTELCSAAEDVEEQFPANWSNWFPYLHMVKKFAGVQVQEQPDQDIMPKDDGVDCPFHELQSDSQKQHHILKRALGHFMAENNLTTESIESFRVRARLWMVDIRKAIKDTMDNYGSEDSIERTCFQREHFEKAMSIPLEMGFCQKNKEKPWTWGVITNERRALLFTLIVGIEDSAYRSIPMGDDGYRLEDGSRTVFNRCSFTGVRSALLAYYGAIANMTVGELEGTDDPTVVGELDSWCLPCWLNADEVYHFGSEYIEVDDSEE